MSYTFDRWQTTRKISYEEKLFIVTPLNIGAESIPYLGGVWYSNTL